VTQNCEDLEKKPLKLYVVGELSGDPNRWSRLIKRTLVFARTRQDALALADFSVVCAEVDLSQPAVLSSQDGCRELQNLTVLLEAAVCSDDKASES
jgi:hypothetical protein